MAKRRKPEAPKPATAFDEFKEYLLLLSREIDEELHEFESVYG